MASWNEKFQIVREVVKLFSLLDCPYSDSELFVKDELVLLDDFFRLIVPCLRQEKSFSDRLNISAEHITHYINRDIIRIAGTTYDALWQLIQRADDSGFFETVGMVPRSDRIPVENVLIQQQLPVRVKCEPLASAKEQPVKRRGRRKQTAVQKHQVQEAVPALPSAVTAPDHKTDNDTHLLHHVEMNCGRLLIGRQRWLACKRFVCAVCRETFSSCIGMRRHVMSQHFMKVSNKILPYRSMPSLQRKTRTPWKLPFGHFRHESIVNCSRCNKHFAYKNCMQIHQQYCMAGLAMKHTKMLKVEEATSNLADVETNAVVNPSPFIDNLLASTITQQCVVGDPNTTIAETSQSKFYKCPSCHKGFSSYAKVKHHIVCCHVGGGRIACRRCMKCFLNKKARSAHELMHIPLLQRLKCDSCCERFATEACLLWHVGKDAQHQCPWCETPHSRCMANNGIRFNGAESHENENSMRITRSNMQSTCFDDETDNDEMNLNCLPVSTDANDASDTESDSPFDPNYRSGHGLRRLGRRPRVKRTAKKPRMSTKFFDNDQLQKRRRSRINGPPTEFVCPECGRYLSSKNNLERHYRLHIGYYPFICQVCGKKFTDRSNLKSHTKVHSGKHGSTECDYLSDATADLPEQDPVSPELPAEVKAIELNLTTNLPTFPPSATVTPLPQPVLETANKSETKKWKKKKKEFPCYVCNKVFPYRSHLYEHFKIHTDDRQFVCEICGKGFKRCGDLTTHSRFHDAEKQFECTDCGQRFRWKNGLERHRRTHTGERPYLCNICGQLFADWGSHKQHVESHNPNAVPPPRFPCKTCGKTFAWKRGLIRHSRSHIAGTKLEPAPDAQSNAVSDVQPPVF